MDEHQWLTSTDPQAMLAWLCNREGHADPPWRAGSAPRVGDRKLRLFACAVARHGNTIGGNRPRVNITEYERRIEEGGRFARSAREDAVGEAEAALQLGPVTVVGVALADLLREIVGNPFRPVTLPVVTETALARATTTTEASTSDPPLITARSYCPWLTPQVLALAEAAYRERVVEVAKKDCGVCCGRGWHRDPADRTGDRCECCETCAGTGILVNRVETGALDPARLAVLSDALEEAGCPAEVEVEKPSMYWHCGKCGNRVELRNRLEAVGLRQRFHCHLCGWREGEYGEVKGTRAWKEPHPLLAHLRSPGPHWRGCWAVDLVLGNG